MFVCECCLAAIESHEGKQPHKRIGFQDLLDMPEGLVFESQLEEFEGQEVMVCEWCDEEIPVDEMFEI